MTLIKAAILAIGSEITGGRIIDTNSSELSKILTSMGIEVVFHMSCADRMGVMREALDLSRKQANLVIITGGLGPTSDDLTRDAVAQTLGRKLITDEATVTKLKAFFKSIDREMAESNLRQAQHPEDSELLTNSAGTAPGFWIKDEHGAIASMPGVPREMRIMFQEQVLPRIREMQGQQNLFFEETTFRTCGIPESRLGTVLDGIETDQLSVAYAVKEAEGCIAVTLTAQHQQKADSRAMLEAAMEECSGRLGNKICARDNLTLVAYICKLLATKNWKLKLHEGMTGGRLATLFNSDFAHRDHLRSAEVVIEPEFSSSDTEERRKEYEQFALRTIAANEDSSNSVVHLACFGPSQDADGIVATVIKTPNGQKNYSRASRLPLRSGRSRFLVYGAAMALDKLRLILEQECAQN